MKSWLKTKRYVLFSERAGRFISVTTHGLKVLSTPNWGCLAKNTHVFGPFPAHECVKFVKWINKEEV